MSTHNPFKLFFSANIALCPAPFHAVPFVCDLIL